MKETIREKMDSESKSLKIGHAVLYGTLFVVYFTCGILFAKRAAEASRVSQQVCGSGMLQFDILCEQNDGTGYDIEFYIWGQYNNEKKAASLLNSLVISTVNDLSKGNNFTTLYRFEAATLFLLAAT